MADIIAAIEDFAPPSLQEDYDNTGLQTGAVATTCTGVLCTLDVTAAVIAEAVEKGCNLVVAHHPLIFRGLKKLNGSNYVEQVLLAAIKAGVTIYAAHTNLDNVEQGVNQTLAARLGLVNTAVLQPKTGLLRRLVTYAPATHAAAVREALFAAGAGRVGRYSECSFNAAGTGTFKAESGASPFVGEVGDRHHEEELRIELIFPFYLEAAVVAALLAHHPYEEVAYSVLKLENRHQGIGSGLIGELANPVDAAVLLAQLKNAFGLKVIKHTPLTGRPVKRVAVCGGAGSFLIKTAAAAGADVFITSDIKYHEFFDAEEKLVVADMGHYESEQFVPALLQQLLADKFPTFAVLKSGVNTNPVQYFL